MHLALERFAHPGMATAKGHMRLLVRRQVDADVQAPEFGGLQLNIGGLQTLARQVHHPVDQPFGPATLLHRQGLVQRARQGHGIRCLGGRGLGQGTEALGEVVDAGIARCALEVLEPIIEQTAEGVFAGFAIGAVLGLLIEQRRQAVGTHLPRRGFRLVGIGRCRRGVGRRLALGLGALLQGQAHRRQIRQGVGGRIECRGQWLLGLRGSSRLARRNRRACRLQPLCIGQGTCFPCIHNRRFSDSCRSSCGLLHAIGWQVFAVSGNAGIFGGNFFVVCAG
ncbi:hypothetical protein D3C85_1016250 [compost metagenome]